MIRALFLLFVMLLVTNVSGAKKIAENQSLVKVKIIVQSDAEPTFTLSNLSLFALIQSKNKAWVSLSNITKDSDGAFVFLVPQNSKISLEILTADPTIRVAVKNKRLHANFYSLAIGKKMSIARKEVVISSPLQEITFNLNRTAAFVPCIPSDISKGSLQFSPLLDNAKYEVNILSFSDSGSSSNLIVGGLEPTQWLVSYVDSDGIERHRETINLTTGQTLKLQCK